MVIWKLYNSIIIGYQKPINVLDHTPNKPTKLRTKNSVETNAGSNGIYNIGSQIEFKNSIIRSSLYDYSEAYIVGKESITVSNTGTTAAPNSRNKNVLFCISEISNKEINHAKALM